MPGRTRIAAVALALALGAGAAAAATFPDPAGDVKGGAGPDITSLSVSHTRTAVTLRLRFAKAPPLALDTAGKWVDMLLVGIDTPPRSLRRGPQGWTGADYYAGLHGTERTGILVRAPTAASPRGAVLARFPVVVGARTLSFSLDRRKLGNPAWLDLVVAVGREMAGPNATGGGEDDAPARGAFHYVLAG